MRKPIPPVPGLHDLVVTRPVYGQRSCFQSPDRAELLDAAHELPCGHLPIESCGCPMTER